MGQLRIRYFQLAHSSPSDVPYQCALILIRLWRYTNHYVLP